jgi:hypothetical protein
MVTDRTPWGKEMRRTRESPCTLDSGRVELRGSVLPNGESADSPESANQFPPTFFSLVLRLINR